MNEAAPRAFAASVPLARLLRVRYWRVRVELRTPQVVRARVKVRANPNPHTNTNTNTNPYPNAAGTPLRGEFEPVLRHHQPRYIGQGCSGREAPGCAAAVRAVRACKAAGEASVPGPRTADHHPQAACRVRARTERILPRLLHRGGGAGLTWGRVGWTDYRSVPRKYSTTL